VRPDGREHSRSFQRRNEAQRFLHETEGTRNLRRGATQLSNTTP
jgi:hypothetical protein